MNKQYLDFESYEVEKIMDSNEYMIHISAMTREDLRAKYEIAIELARRDIKIKELINNTQTKRDKQ